jgi:hypothetical protein
LVHFGFVPQNVFVYCSRIKLGEQTETLYQPFVNVDIVTEKWASNSKEILSEFLNLTEKGTRGRDKYAATLLHLDQICSCTLDDRSIVCNVHNLKIEINPLARNKVLMYDILFRDIIVYIAIFSSLYSENEIGCQVLNSIRSTTY